MYEHRKIDLFKQFFPDNTTVQAVAGLHYFVRTYTVICSVFCPQNISGQFPFPSPCSQTSFSHSHCNNTNTMPDSHYTGISTHSVMLNTRSALPLLKLNRQSPEYPSRTLKNLCKQAIRNSTNPDRLMLLEVEKWRHFHSRKRKRTSLSSPLAWQLWRGFLFRSRTQLTRHITFSHTEHSSIKLINSLHTIE